MDESNFIPTHYFLGLIPCEATQFENACTAFTFDDDTFNLWGMDNLTKLSQTLYEFTKQSNYILIDEVDAFLNMIEEKTK